jgi:hypothetical protein
MKMPIWFSKLPVTVKLAGIFLVLVYVAALSLVPHIVIPISVILFSVVSLMRIFIYLVEGR